MHLGFCLYILPEEFRCVVVALHRLGQDDVHMEHMGYMLIFRGTIDPAHSGNALCGEKITHGLGIVPEEAAIVRRIFQNFLDGKSRLETEREFAAEGITTRDGCRWVDSNLKVVLTNITYTGNLLLQKEYVEDPLTKKRKKNRGELAQFYVDDTH